MYRNENYLKEEYLEKGRSLSDIAKEFNISPKLLFYYTKKFGFVGKKVRTKYTVNEDKFSIKDPVFYYYAGLVATDGYIDVKNNRVSVRVNNLGSHEVLSSLKQHFEFQGIIRVYRGSNDLTITSKKLIKVLEKLNISGTKKSSVVRYPDSFPNEECERLFLRGVLDGDGNIHTHKSSYTGNTVGGEFRLSSSCESLVQGVINSVNNLIGTSYTMKYSSNSSKAKYPSLEMQVQDSKDLYSVLYDDYEKFRFKDKYEKYQQIR